MAAMRFHAGDAFLLGAPVVQIMRANGRCESVHE
jgi:hypothetical protein